MDTKLELSPWLASVFVAPEYRQKGIGTKLVLHVMGKAKDEGISTLYLFTSNKGKFYKDLGWSTFGEELYRGEEVAIMKLFLSKP
jgi:N-acetylglutamate synthase-like GNAT family acetyltransferase